nr:RNA-directed DNA polymerase, eukaryota [Tanacetum cinerariifolium]
MSFCSTMVKGCVCKAFEEESDIEAISETFFGDQADYLNKVVDSAQQSIPKETSYDPFKIYDILNKENKDVNAAATNSSIPFPPGFTPDKPDTDVGEPVAQKDQFQPDVKSKKKESGSILEILEEMISVSQTMGFSMEGSIKDMERIVDLKGMDDVEKKAENVSDMEIKSLWGFDDMITQTRNSISLKIVMLWPSRIRITCCSVATWQKILLGLFVIGGAWFGTLLIRTDLGYLGLIWFSFNQVRNRCWKECFTLPGRVSGHIETISSSLIQILEKMVFLKT